MRLPLLPILAVLALGVAVDIYIYRRLRCRHAARGWCVAYTIVSLLASVALIAVICLPKRAGDDTALHAIMWTLFAYFSVYIPKYIFALFSMAGRLLGRIARRAPLWAGAAGAVIGLAVSGAMWWGALHVRFDTEVRRVDVVIDRLPQAFDGYRIVQLSDIHTGTYLTDTTYLSELVGEVNALHPDLIVFTGDIVNRRSRELRPFASTLSRLSAPGGVWSITGNHDYGDYYTWPSEAEHRADVDSLRAIQRAMGWHMLDNAHTWLRAGADSIALVGVENIGDAPFPVYGSLTRAYPTPTDSVVKILLSHNPQHWVDSVSGRSDARFDLTLSGHTHAMQMQIGGLSPAAWRYPTWGGMYTDSLGRRLYVNIGIGEVAIPARIGSARPEVTLITLRKSPTP